jgi:glycosyltransferase involved in cell wall biosynthesis
MDPEHHTHSVRVSSSTSAGSVWAPHDPVARIGSGRRILHVATRFLRGGAERNIAHFIGWELAAGYEVEVAFGREAEFAAIPNDIRAHELKRLTRNVDPPNDLLAVRELRSLLRAGKYDLVHTHLSKAGVVGRIAARDLVQHVAHTVHMASFGQGYSQFASALFRYAERRCAPLADIIVFVGADLRNLYEEAGIGTARNIMIIHSPIDIAPLVASRTWDKKRRAEVRQRLGIGQEPLMLAIGALHPRKRYGLMLERLAPLMRATGARLAIAGDGSERGTLETAATRYGIRDRLHLLGHVADVTEPLAVADVVVHASAVEGVPQAVVQALAAGRAVVATDVTGLREISGAPITIVSASGARLADAAAHALAADPAAPLDPGLLQPWTCRSIDVEISAFHARMRG